MVPSSWVGSPEFEEFGDGVVAGDDRQSVVGGSAELIEFQSVDPLVQLGDWWATAEAWRTPIGGTADGAVAARELCRCRLCDH
jgi:hypothetical protein